MTNNGKSRKPLYDIIIKGGKKKSELGQYDFVAAEMYKEGR